MRNIQERIAAYKRRLGEHELFARMRPRPDLKSTMAFAPAITTWVMNFQDVIRINARLARDPHCKALLERHVSEDRGHERWFFEDMELIFGREVLDITWLIQHENASAREAALAIASEVFHIGDDRLRIVYIEALEAASHIFIEHVHPLVQESGHADRLKYFGGTHARAEAGHELFEAETERRMHEIVLPEEVRREAFALIERLYAGFSALADAAVARMS